MMSKKQDKTFFTYEEKLKLKEEILKLTPNDWTSICTGILIPNNERLTIKQGGVFFCLINTSNKSVNAIKRFIEHKNSFNN